MLVGDELEFAISQYLDGHLSSDAVVVLEERLATDADARETLRRYQIVHATLRAAPTVPTIDWDALLRETQTRVAGEWVRSNVQLTPSPLRLTGVWTAGRARVRWLAPIALAASVLIAVTGAAVFLKRSRTPTMPIVATVVGPHAELPSGPVIAQVSIGAAPSVASNSYRGSDDVVDRPSVVLIDRADNPAPDADALY